MNSSIRYQLIDGNKLLTISFIGLLI